MKEDAMSAWGNDPGPYSAKGRRQCEEKLRTECRKLMVIVSEAPAGGDVATYLRCLDKIQYALGTMERLRVDHE